MTILKIDNAETTAKVISYAIPVDNSMSEMIIQVSTKGEIMSVNITDTLGRYHLNMSCQWYGLSKIT